MRNPEVATSSVDRALSLILLLRDTPSLSVKESAERLGVSPATAYRLLSTLRARDFAIQDPDRRYRAGPNVLPSGVRMKSLEELRILFRPILAATQAKLNETINLWGLEGVYVRNVDGIESTEALAIRVNAWTSVPAYVSAAGKSILACFEDSVIERMHTNGLPQWPGRHANSMPALLNHLKIVRDRGYATNIEEAADGVCGIGVAVTNSDGDPVAGFSCGVPGVRFSAGRAVYISKILQESAEEMGTYLH